MSRVEDSAPSVSFARSDGWCDLGGAPVDDLQRFAIQCSAQHALLCESLESGPLSRGTPPDVLEAYVCRSYGSWTAGPTSDLGVSIVRD